MFNKQNLWRVYFLLNNSDWKDEMIDVIIRLMKKFCKGVKIFSRRLFEDCWLKFYMKSRANSIKNDKINRKTKLCWKKFLKNHLNESSTQLNKVLWWNFYFFSSWCQKLMKKIKPIKILNTYCTLEESLQRRNKNHQISLQKKSFGYKIFKWFLRKTKFGFSQIHRKPYC